MTMRRFALFVMVSASVLKIILMGCLTTPIREPANSPTSTSLSGSARTVITVLYVFAPTVESNEGYFSCWEDFFDSWNEDCEEFAEKPLYVWGTEEVEMSFDASSIVSDACEDMYEDAYDDIGADAVAEMQRYLDEWKKKYGRTSYLLTTKHAIRIPWEEMK